MKSNKKTLTLDFNNFYEADDFTAILICAVRYSLGRRTYMPSTVTGFIMNHCKDMLSKRDLSVMISDVEKCNDYGHSCDVETWMNFLKWLKNEYEKIKDD